ncbi:hypothetical protein ACVWWP_007212 [Bradyrhizobium sp. LM3.6]
MTPETLALPLGSINSPQTLPIMTDAQWEVLKPYYSWASGTWRNGLNQSTKQVGFYHRSGELAFFIEALVQNLSPLSSVAA